MLWYLKQLFPLTYRTTYGDEKGRHFVVWRMWFGRCFAVEDVITAEPIKPVDQESIARGEVRVELAVSPMGDYTAIGGDRLPGEGDTTYIGFERLNAVSKKEAQARFHLQDVIREVLSLVQDQHYPEDEMLFVNDLVPELRKILRVAT